MAERENNLMMVVVSLFVFLYAATMQDTVRRCGNGSISPKAMKQRHQYSSVFLAVSILALVISVGLLVRDW